jgi:hypothetical protein
MTLFRQLGKCYTDPKYGDVSVRKEAHMSWKKQLRKDSLRWLLESDDPGVRYLAFRDLLDLSPDDKKLKSACKAAHREGPIAEVLSQMNKAGYWVKAGPGYNPKYRSTVWSLILLAQLGASASEDRRIEQACSYLLDHMAEGGQFTSKVSLRWKRRMHRSVITPINADPPLPAA